MPRRSQRTRQGPCPACGGATPRTARWCGRCGAPLAAERRDHARARTTADASDTTADASDTTADDSGEAGPRPRPRWLLGAAGVLVAAAAVTTVTAVVTAGDLAGDRLGRGAADTVDLADEPVAVRDEPVCLADPACVAWLEPVADAGGAPAATVAGDLTLVRVPDGLEARDTDSGELRWRSPLDAATDREDTLPVRATDGLALVTDGGRGDSRLLAHDLRTGEVRWQLDGVTELTDLYAAADVTLLHLHRPDQQVVAVRPHDGEVVWTAEAAGLLRLAVDAAVIVDEDAIVVVGSDGVERWRRPVDTEEVPAWLNTTGSLVQPFDRDGRAGPVLSLADGEPVEVDDGELVPVAAPDDDPAETFLTDVAGVRHERADGGVDLTLLEGDQVAWQVTFERLGCCAPLRLVGEGLAVLASDGGRWVLDRADGSVLERLPPDDDGASASLLTRSGVSVEELDRADTGTGLALVDAGRRVARVPADAWPVGVTDEVIVVRSGGWVAAVRRDSIDRPQ